MKVNEIVLPYDLVNCLIWILSLAEHRVLVSTQKSSDFLIKNWSLHCIPPSPSPFSLNQPITLKIVNSVEGGVVLWPCQYHYKSNRTNTTLFVLFIRMNKTYFWFTWSLVTSHEIGKLCDSFAQLEFANIYLFTISNILSHPLTLLKRGQFSLNS